MWGTVTLLWKFMLGHSPTIIPRVSSPLTVAQHQALLARQSKICSRVQDTRSHKLSKESTNWHDIRGRLEGLAHQYPEWQPSLQLWQAILYALDDRVWEEAVLQSCPDRPAAAPLLAGMVCHVDARKVGRWVRSLVKLARQNTAPGQAVLLQVNFHQEDVLALLEAALCQDHARLTALAEGLG